MGTRVVFCRTNGAAFVGHFESQVFLVGSNMVGIWTLYGGGGGVLYLRGSTNRLSLAEIRANPEATAERFVKSQDHAWLRWARTDRALNLHPYFGGNALFDMRRADAPPPPSITSASFEGSLLVLKMRSSVGKDLVLALDADLKPVRATVDGKVTFDGDKNRPPPDRLDEAPNFPRN
jgi:hypothetical protein